jgi:lysophospholipase L1-like esterase
MSNGNGHTKGVLMRPALVLGVLGVFMVIAGWLGYKHFLENYPYGVGPAGPSVPALYFSKEWTDRKVVLVGLGDSITAGFNIPKEKTYFSMLITNPPNDYSDMLGKCLSAVLPNLSWTNLAVSGSTSIDLFRDQLPRLPVFSADYFGIVVITTGGNDIIHNYGHTRPTEGAMFGATLAEARPWINNFAERLEQMLIQIHKKFEGNCLIYLGTIYDPTDDQGDAETLGLPAWPDGRLILRQYNDVILSMPQKFKFVRIVDIHRFFLGHGAHFGQFWSDYFSWEDPHLWYLPNFEDPSERGHDTLRRLFLNAIGKDFYEQSLKQSS